MYMYMWLLDSSIQMVRKYLWSCIRICFCFYVKLSFGTNVRNIFVLDNVFTPYSLFIFLSILTQTCKPTRGHLSIIMVFINVNIIPIFIIQIFMSEHIKWQNKYTCLLTLIDHYYVYNKGYTFLSLIKHV